MSVYRRALVFMNRCMNMCACVCSGCAGVCTGVHSGAFRWPMVGTLVDEKCECVCLIMRIYAVFLDYREQIE